MNSTSPSEFGPEALLVLVGHSSDAVKEAHPLAAKVRAQLEEWKGRKGK